uniref:mRNA export factor GLE1 n=3 Tax=Cacopsylla melanoneura TaxID=428564 RepID=A0A8D9AB72_9HEMI
MMNRPYKSSSSLLRSPRLHLNEPKIKISDLPNSKFTFNSKPAHYVSKKTDFESQILCNVEDVFKKSPSCRLKTNVNLDLSLSPASNLTVSRLHRSNEESYTQDLSLKESIESKIQSIFEDVHELTLGPNAILHDDNKDDTTKQEGVPDSEDSNCKPPCQDLAISSEDSSALDEGIRIYLKNECTEKSYSYSSKKFSEAMNQFSCKQNREYLDKKKSIELSVLSDQLRQQTQLTTEAQLSANLNMVKKNVMARQGISNVLQNLMKQETEDKMKKEKEKQEGLMAICKVVNNTVNTFKSKEEIFLNNLTKCRNVARFQQEGQELIGFNKRFCLDLMNLITKCKQGSITNEDVTHLNKLMTKSLDCFDRLGKIHETIQVETAAAQAAAAAAQASAAEAQVAAAKAQAEMLTQAQPTVQSSPARAQGPDTSSTNRTSSTDNTSPLSTIIDPISLQTYKEMSENYKSVEQKLEKMMTDPDLKTFRFQCIKAFNIPINAIDTQHTLEQYNRLTSVLRGDKTVGTGRNMQRVSDHPLGVLFCMYSMAKKFVSHVDVKPCVLFAYASVIVELWREFPDFGKLLLGAFHEQCPYLIPVFWPQQEGQSNEQYYKSLGYQYIDGQVEKQELFLKRIIAMTQLYAAITITPTRAGGSKPHPHNLMFSWRWMAAMLSLDPQPDVSATLLYSYIKIAGNKMAVTYRKQFFKLIHFIKNNYLRRIKQVTPEDQSQQSIYILEELVNNIVKTNHVPPPEGQLPAKLW